LAIGRRGQNVRLASQLTGWRLDIVSESKVKEIKDRAFKSLGRLAGVNDIHMQTLYNYGIRCAQDVLNTDEAFLANIPGIGVDMAARLKKDGLRVVEEERLEARQLKKEEELKARAEAKQMFDDLRARGERLPEYERLIRVKGVGRELASNLEVAGILSVEELADIHDLKGAAEKSQVPAEKLDQLRHAAQVYLKKEADGVDLSPSSPDAGPEEGYAPSRLLDAGQEQEEATA
jgi:N utilization substance protein A